MINDYNLKTPKNSITSTTPSRYKIGQVVFHKKETQKNSVNIFQIF
jgi:hypothetical protein